MGFFNKLIGSVKAATAVEYGLVLALIFIGALFAIGAVADKTSILWNRVGDEATQAMARNS